MINKLFFFGFILLILHSCGSVRQNVPPSGEVEDQSLIAFQQAYKSSLPAFDYVQIRTRMDAAIDGKNVNATLRLYIDNEDLIWANASMLGITGARAHITPEGVKAYEVLDKTFIDSDFTFFNEKLKVNFIDYNRLQQLLLGQLFLIEPWTSYSLETTSENEYALHYKQNEALNRNPQNGKYIHSFFLDSNYRLNRVEIVDKSSETTITATYEGWHQINGRNLPGKVNVVIKGKDTDSFNLEYNNFDFTQMNPPFRIPEGYSPRKLN